MPNRRVVLIENPPKIWAEDGLIYVDFGIEGGTLLAYRPSVLLETHSRCDNAIKEWIEGKGQILAFKTG